MEDKTKIRENSMFFEGNWGQESEWIKMKYIDSPDPKCSQWLDEWVDPCQGCPNFKPDQLSVCHCTLGMPKVTS